MLIPFYKNDLYREPGVIQELEDAFAKTVGTKYAVAVDSCTNAIACCLDYLIHTEEIWVTRALPYAGYVDLKPRTQISIPDMTYVSVANEICRRNIDLTLDTRFTAGKSYELFGTRIVDSAHEVVHMADPGNKLYCYSFYPTKLVPSYEGGMIATNDAKATEWLKTYRQMGRTAYGAEYDVVSLGLKCNMTDIQAERALRSLKELEFTKVVHARISDSYIKMGIPLIRKTSHLVIVATTADNHEVLTELRTLDVEGSIHFRPISKKCAYDEYTTDYQVASFSHRIISLPMHPTMSDYEVQTVANRLKHVVLDKLGAKFLNAKDIQNIYGYGEGV
jgi:perosamine synthetase